MQAVFAYTGNEIAKLPKHIEAALQRLEPSILEAFLEAIDQIYSAAQMKRLVAAIEDSHRGPSHL